jgi:hypothetical protein
MSDRVAEPVAPSWRPACSDGGAPVVGGGAGCRGGPGVTSTGGPSVTTAPAPVLDVGPPVVGVVSVGAALSRAIGGAEGAGVPPAGATGDNGGAGDFGGRPTRELGFEPVAGGGGAGGAEAARARGGRPDAGAGPGGAGAVVVAVVDVGAGSGETGVTRTVDVVLGADLPLPVVVVALGLVVVELAEPGEWLPLAALAVVVVGLAVVDVAVGAADGPAAEPGGPAAQAGSPLTTIARPAEAITRPAVLRRSMGSPFGEPSAGSGRSVALVRGEPTRAPSRPTWSVSDRDLRRVRCLPAGKEQLPQRYHWQQRPQKGVLVNAGWLGWRR